LLAFAGAIAPGNLFAAMSDVQTKRIKADYASGKSLKKILEDELSAGGSISGIVGCLVSEGANPGSCVIAANAATNGTGLGDAITAALNAKGENKLAFLDAVVAAAGSTGAHQGIIGPAAVAANIPGNNVANAMSLANVPPAPVSGHSAPSVTSDVASGDKTFGAGNKNGVDFGGGGGGTGPASRHQTSQTGKR